MGKVAALGLWHLGSVASGCLAEVGHPVIGFDRDNKKVEELNRGVSPLFEPGLERLLTKNIRLGRLSFTTRLGEALAGADYVLLTYDTPVTERDEVDLSLILSTVTDMAPLLEGGATVIVLSQVPVGTCEKLSAIIKGLCPGLDFSLVYSPENLRLGQAIERFMKPAMVVLGSDTPQGLERAERLFSFTQAPKLKTDLRTAEMVKHTINAYLAAMISFVNEMTDLCEEVGADALTVARALSLDERVSPRAPLQPGLGFAGGTLARDLNVLRNLAQVASYKAHLIDGIAAANEQRKGIVVKKLREALGALEDRKVGILGLTYKAGTSTLRRSLALEVACSLSEAGSRVRVYDPQVDREEVEALGYLEFCEDLYALAEGVDGLVILTDWPEFKTLDYQRIKNGMRTPLILDMRNMLDPAPMVAMGFRYMGIGRGRRCRA